MGYQTVTFFSTTFSGATNPGLTPIPFTSTTETSSNTIRYDATGGISSSPAAKVSFAGTSADSYGQYDLGSQVPTSGKIFTFIFNINFGILPYVGLSNQNISLLRVTGDDGMLVNVQLYKPAAGTPKLRISDAEHSTNTNGSTTLAASTWYEIKLVLDATPGSESLTLYLNGTQEAQKTGTGAFSRRIGSLWFGAVTGSGVPVLGVNWDIDTITCTAQVPFAQIPVMNKSFRPMGSTNIGSIGVGF